MFLIFNNLKMAVLVVECCAALRTNDRDTFGLEGVSVDTNRAGATTFIWLRIEPVIGPNVTTAVVTQFHLLVFFVIDVLLAIIETLLLRTSWGGMLMFFLVFWLCYGFYLPGSKPTL